MYVCMYNLVPVKGQWYSAAGKVTAGLADSNGSLPPGGWLIVTCGLTACTPGSAPGPTFGNEYGKPLPLPFNQTSATTASNTTTPPLAAPYQLNWQMSYRRDLPNQKCVALKKLCSDHVLNYNINTPTVVNSVFAAGVAMGKLDQI